MTDKSPEPEAPAAEAAALEQAEETEPAENPDEVIRVRWDGPRRLVPDYAAAIASHYPDRIPPTLEPGDILEIPRRHRTSDHGDTTSVKAAAVNVPKES